MLVRKLLLPLSFFILANTWTACEANSESKEKAILAKEKELQQKEQELKAKEQTLNNNAKLAPTEEYAPAIDDAKKDLNFLKKFEGKYPYDVHLLDHPILKERLKKMLGEKYDFIKNTWDVETPIEIEDGMFYAWGMQAHSGGDPGAVIMADLNKNVLYVGIRENEKTKVFSEDGSPVPQRLQGWADEE